MILFLHLPQQQQQQLQIYYFKMIRLVLKKTSIIWIQLPTFGILVKLRTAVIGCYS